MRSRRLAMPLVIGLLAAAAVALNVYAPTVFFDSQMMIGGSLGVFALLQFGWPGLVVGVAALAVTFVRWGHPFELIVGTGFLVWLQVFLTRGPGGPANRGNSRVLLAAIAYWLLVGFWLEAALFRIAFGMGSLDVIGLALKEMVTSLCNATLGFLLFTAVSVARRRLQKDAIRPREVAVGLVLAGAGPLSRIDAATARSILLCTQCLPGQGARHEPCQRNHDRHHWQAARRQHL